MTEPRVLVFAYHDVGYACLETLFARGANVISVFTHADDPRERIWFRSVAELARKQGVPTYTPERVNTAEWIEHIRALQPDLIFSFYYRNLICTDILNGPRLGAYNMHGSLLPKYRGRAPINWAVLNGESETGVTLHVMTERADAGDIVDQERVPIGVEETAQQVFVKATAAARTVLQRNLDDLLRGTAKRRPQNDNEATYFGGRRPEHGRIDWQLDARAVFNLIRAVTHPYPGAFTELNGRRLYIWSARPIAFTGARPGEVVGLSPLTIACGRDCLEVQEWQWSDGAASEPARGTVFDAPVQSAVTGVQA